MLVQAFDVGGVYIKSTVVDVDETGTCTLLATIRRPFSFRQHASDLEIALAGELRAHRYDCSIDRVVFTMTAETVGIFDTLAEGVIRICRVCAASFPQLVARFLSVHGTLQTLDRVEMSPLDFASTNWVATAALAALSIDNGLFLDVGSTTTDIIPIVNSRVRPAQVTDLGRLGSGELVYAGIERTYLSCLTPTLPLRDRNIPIAAEIRAFTAHVYVLLGWLMEFDMLHPFNAQPMQVNRATGIAALTRSVCADPSLISEDEVIRMAQFVRDRQIELTSITCSRIIANNWPVATPLQFVAAGSGSRIATAALQRLDTGVVVDSPALDVDPANATTVALAHLAVEGCIHEQLKAKEP